MMFIVKTFKGTRLQQWRCCNFELNRLFSSPLREPFLMASSPPHNHLPITGVLHGSRYFITPLPTQLELGVDRTIKGTVAASGALCLLRYYASWKLTAIPCNTRAATQLLSQLQREEEDDEASVFDQHLIYCFIQITSRVCT